VSTYGNESPRGHCLFRRTQFESLGENKLPRCPHTQPDLRPPRAVSKAVDVLRSVGDRLASCTASISVRTAF